MSAWHQVSERDDDNQLVNEHGAIIGLTGALANRTGAWRFGIDGDLLGGSLDYDGATQLGADLATNTDWERRSVGAFFDRRIRSPIRADIGGNLEYQWRNRDIASTIAAAGLQLESPDIRGRSRWHVPTRS